MLTAFIIFAILFSIVAILIVRGGSENVKLPLLGKFLVFAMTNRFDCIDGLMLTVAGAFAGREEYMLAGATWLCWLMVRIAIAVRRQSDENTYGASEGAFPVKRFEEQ